MAQRLDRARRLENENALLRQRLVAAERDLDAVIALRERPVETFRIAPSAGRAGEATAFLIASDWHVEERVDPAMVNGLNAYDLDESRRRAVRFFQHGLRLVRMCARDVAIPTVVLALLGDFFTNSIHEDCAENNLLPPIDAAILAEEYLASGLEMLLRETKAQGTRFVVPCHSGNHGRTTKERRIATEPGNSLERFLYAHLARRFATEPRVSFAISRGYHSYLDVYGATIRVHHGHEIRYHGGVGGITIPVNKAIAAWQTLRPAHLDVFGHFHQQLLDAGAFVSNGSLIGHSPFAIAIKARFERPRQAFFLWDKRRGKTGCWPIIVDVDA